MHPTMPHAQTSTKKTRPMTDSNDLVENMASEMSACSGPRLQICCKQLSEEQRELQKLLNEVWKRRESLGCSRQEAAWGAMLQARSGAEQPGMRRGLRSSPLAKGAATADKQDFQQMARRMSSAWKRWQTVSAEDADSSIPKRPSKTPVGKLRSSREGKVKQKRRS